MEEMLSNNDPDGVVSARKIFEHRKISEENLAKDSQSDVIEAVPIYMRATIYIFGAVVIGSSVMTYLIKVYVLCSQMEASCRGQSGCGQSHP